MPPLVPHAAIFVQTQTPAAPIGHVVLRCAASASCLLPLNRHILSTSAHAYIAAGGIEVLPARSVEQNWAWGVGWPRAKSTCTACECEKRKYLLLYPSVPTRHSEWLLELNTDIYAPTLLLLTPLQPVVLGSARTSGPPVPAGHRPRSPFHCPREETTPALSCLSAHVTSLEISTRRWNRGHTLGVGPDIKRRI